MLDQRWMEQVQLYQHMTGQWDRLLQVYREVQERLHDHCRSTQDLTRMATETYLRIERLQQRMADTWREMERLLDMGFVPGDRHDAGGASDWGSRGGSPYGSSASGPSSHEMPPPPPPQNKHRPATPRLPNTPHPFGGHQRNRRSW